MDSEIRGKIAIRRSVFEGAGWKTNRYRGGQIVLDLDGREVRVDTVTITDLIVNLGRVAAVRNGG